MEIKMRFMDLTFVAMLRTCRIAWVFAVTIGSGFFQDYACRNAGLNSPPRNLQAQNARMRHISLESRLDTEAFFWRIRPTTDICRPPFRLGAP